MSRHARAPVEKTRRPPAKATQTEAERLLKLTRMEQLCHMLELTMAALEDARKGHSHVAVRQMLRDVEQLVDKIEALRKQAEQAGQDDPGRLTPEAWATRLNELAQQCSVPDLEVFVQAYLQRHPNLRLSAVVEA